MDLLQHCLDNFNSYDASVRDPGANSIRLFLHVNIHAVDEVMAIIREALEWE
jgi:hypothetical protein